jgi:GMP synthase (glutamine-hydrolysing)
MKLFKEQIWVLDFGSQFTQLIIRRTRECGYSCRLMTVKEAMTILSDQSSENRREHWPKALILSGGPHSVYQDTTDYSCLWSSRLPILGICYGMQLMGHALGGEVTSGLAGEYGTSEVLINDDHLRAYFQATSDSSSLGKIPVWMSHGDCVKKAPEGFKVVGHSNTGVMSAMIDIQRKYFGLQFHPEVQHSLRGELWLQYFFSRICSLPQDWSPVDMKNIIEQEMKSTTGVEHILCAFSGGVDSLVASTLANNLYPERVWCFFVDNGLLRHQDLQHIETLKKETSLNIHIIDAAALFLDRLKDVTDPEEKRKIIGRTFIEVFEQKVREYADSHRIHFTHLLQGTLYPDVIESTGPHQKDGKSVTIKSHHNVGGLPEKMNLKLFEPLRWLFKDEVREVGKQCGLKVNWVNRHPFPGPGLGVRVLGAIEAEGLRKVRDSDRIMDQVLRETGYYDKIWQAFCVHLPVFTVGVKGDGRSYETVICLRMVTSSDGMTARYATIPDHVFEQISVRITNEVKGVTRVVYDITHKPPGTIEWE